MWKERAICKDANPELFFDTTRQEEAVAVCNTCPVIEECLRHAVVNNLDWGVWGGVVGSRRRYGKKELRVEVSGGV